MHQGDKKIAMILKDRKAPSGSMLLKRKHLGLRGYRIEFVSRGKWEKSGDFQR